MKVKLFVAAVALSLAPGMALAMCGMQQSASQCQQGTVWDEDTRTCIAPVSS